MKAEIEVEIEKKGSIVVIRIKSESEITPENSILFLKLITDEFKRSKKFIIDLSGIPGMGWCSINVLNRLIEATIDNDKQMAIIDPASITSRASQAGLRRIKIFTREEEAVTFLSNF